MPHTIHFNTGRKYTAAGQRITATLHPDGVVTFWDHDRRIDGQFDLPHGVTFSRHVVLTRYDLGQYATSARSHSDGMQRGGCNTSHPEVTA